MAEAESEIACGVPLIPQDTMTNLKFHGRFMVRENSSCIPTFKNRHLLRVLTAEILHCHSQFKSARPAYSRSESIMKHDKLVVALGEAHFLNRSGEQQAT